MAANGWMDGVDRVMAYGAVGCAFVMFVRDVTPSHFCALGCHCHGIF